MTAQRLIGPFLVVALVAASAQTAEPTVSDLVKALGSPDPAVRLDACQDLADFPLSAEAAKTLLKALRDVDAKVRQSALIALTEFGTAAAPAVPVLRQILADNRSELRADALVLLASIGPDAKAALPEIEALLEGPDDLLRVLAARARLRIEPSDVAFLAEAISRLVDKGLRHPNVHVRGQVTQVLGEIGSPAVDQLCAALDASESHVRCLAADALAAMGAGSAAAVPKLVEKLGAGDGPIRWHAAHALGAIGPAAKAAVPALVAALTTNEPRTRLEVCKALAAIGLTDKADIASLAKLILDENMSVQLAAIAALRQLDPKGELAHPALLKALRDEDPAVQARAIEALALAGQTGIPGLIEELKEENARYSAALVISELGPSAAAAVPALIGALKRESSPETERELLLALAAVGADAKDAVPLLIHKLSDTSPLVRRPAILALGRIGSAAKSALPALAKLAGAQDERERHLLAWAEVCIDPQNAQYIRQAMPVLVKGLEDPLPLVRLLALEALRLIGDGAKDAVPALLKTLSDPDPEVRHEALMALAQIGVPDSSIGRLAELLRDEVEPVRRGAAFALGRVGPAGKPALPALRANLSAEDPLLRVISAWSTVRIDPSNQPARQRALAVLRQAAKDNNQIVSRAARQALENLDKD